MYKIITTYMIPPRLPVVAMSLLSASTGNLHAVEVFKGPVLARVERVVDGDTIAVKAAIWLGQDIRVFVRVNGIDTPELRGKCLIEKKLAHYARQFVINWTYSRHIKLKNIRRGKYAGRIIADVVNNQGYSLADGLLKNGLAHPYYGGKKPSWCNRDTPMITSQTYNK